MISKDKTYRTRDGREVRIYATDGLGVCCVHGAALRHTGAGWELMTWSSDGAGWHRPNDDLIEVKPRHQRTVWLNVFQEGTVVVYGERKREGAHILFGDHIACLRVDLDFEEGQGL